MINKKHFFHFFLSLLLLAGTISCRKNDDEKVTPDPPKEDSTGTSDISLWLTNPDKSALFERQSSIISFTSETNSNATIEIDTSKTFQTIDGFGYTLTGGSAFVINQMAASEKAALLNELFTTDSTFLGVSYLRISIGASDLSAAPFTYNDLPSGQTDPGMASFSLEKDQQDVIPLLKEIIAINPDIKILGSPWSAPTWMKTNNSFIGGSLKPEFYDAYATYFVKYIQGMKEGGINIDAITIQNEPLNPNNNPSMSMTAAEQATFIKNHLGPAFETAAIETKIIIYDHNADVPQYPISILDDPDANKYVDGSAFHLYGGDISALSTVHNAHPDKSIYFTEQYVGASGSFAGDIGWHFRNLIIGATRNWSRTVIEWNLAADADNGPHTEGGCDDCLPALTVQGNNITRNTSYYIIAHAAKFVRPGSVRVESNISGNLHNVAFLTPEGKKVLIVYNGGGSAQTFNIKFKDRIAKVLLNGAAVGTFVW